MTCALPSSPAAKRADERLSEVGVSQNEAREENPALCLNFQNTGTNQHAPYYN